MSIHIVNKIVQNVNLRALLKPIVFLRDTHISNDNKVVDAYFYGVKNIVSDGNCVINTGVFGEDDDERPESAGR